jgi:glycosyltransferase involved in cell wall biosynthesis
MSMRIRVLHLAPHLGGGVGAVVRALISNSARQGAYVHVIACLEGLNDESKKWAFEAGVGVDEHLWQDRCRLDALIAGADIVHMHWWHHPLLNALMHRSDLPPFRAALWTHVNGLFPPQNFPEKLADYADLLVLATPASLPLLSAAVNLRVIQSNAGTPPMPPQAPRRDGRFCIGYVGTVDPVKMHPDFVAMSLNASIVDAKYVVAGGPKHEALRREIAQGGQGARFDVLGPVGNVGELMASFDVFGYPLSPSHYGTGEQVLIEAMAAGAVPVVLDNSCEKHIVEHEVTGLVCPDTTSYSKALKRLYDDRELLLELSTQARQQAVRRFAMSLTVDDWHARYRELMQMPRRLHVMSGTGDDILSLFLGALVGTEAGRIFCEIARGERASGLERLPSACFSATRGSVFHYRQFFPEDSRLANFCNLLNAALSQQNTEVTP